MKLPGHAFTLVFEPFDILLRQSAAYVGTQIGEFYLACQAATALTRGIYDKTGDNDKQKSQCGEKPHQPVCAPSLASGESELGLLRLIFDCQLTETLGLFAGPEGVAQFVSFQQCLIGVAVIAQRSVGYMHVVVAVKDNERKIVDAFQTENFVEILKRFFRTVIFKRDGAFRLIIGQHRHGRFDMRKDFLTFQAPCRGFRLVAEAVGRKHRIDGRSESAVAVSGFRSVFVSQFLIMESLLIHAASGEHRACRAENHAPETGIVAFRSPFARKLRIIRCFLFLLHVEIKSGKIYV